MNAALLLSTASRHCSTCKLLLMMATSPDAAVKQLSSVVTASAWAAAAGQGTRDWCFLVPGVTSVSAA